MKRTKEHNKFYKEKIDLLEGVTNYMVESICTFLGKYKETAEFSKGLENYFYAEFDNLIRDFKVANKKSDLLEYEINFRQQVVFPVIQNTFNFGEELFPKQLMLIGLGKVSPNDKNLDDILSRGFISVCKVSDFKCFSGSLNQPRSDIKFSEPLGKAIRKYGDNFSSIYGSSFSYEFEALATSIKMADFLMQYKESGLCKNPRVFNEMLKDIIIPDIKKYSSEHNVEIEDTFIGKEDLAKPNEHMKMINEVIEAKKDIATVLNK